MPPAFYLYSYLMALAWFLWNMRWLIPPTAGGYFVLSCYLACYFPLIACPIRHAVRRRRMAAGLSIVPIVWTGQEMPACRPWVTGFPWFLPSRTAWPRCSR